MRKRSVIAGALLAASGLVQAASPGALGVIDDIAVPIGNSVQGFFFDTYTFDLTVGADITGSAFSFELPSLFSISSFTAVLQDSSFTTLGTDTDPSDGFSFAGLASGSYALTLLGFASGSAGGVYAGVISAQTTPVPEPESMALLLAGLAAVGFTAARRRPVT